MTKRTRSRRLATRRCSQFIFDDRGNNEPARRPLDCRVSRLSAENLRCFLLTSTVTSTDRSFEQYCRRHDLTSSYADPLEFGKLESSASGIVYTSADGTQYHAKHYHTADEARIANTGEDYYLIDRIEQAGVDFSPADTSTEKRRGVAFEWNTTDAAVKHSMLTRIVSSDLSATVFEYSAGYLTSTKLFSSVNASGANVGSTVHQVDYSVVGGLLKEVRDANAGGTPFTRKFSYAGEILKLDQLYNGIQAGSLVLAAQETIDIDMNTSRVTAIHNGDPSGPSGSYLSSTVTVGSLLNTDPQRPGEIIATISEDASGMNNLVLGQPAPVSGFSETLIGMDMRGHEVSTRAQFRVGSSTTSLGEEKWTYDVVGLVNSASERIAPTGNGSDAWRKTFYRHDYEIPTSYTSTDPGTPDASPKYDPSDYRGNVTYVIGLDGETKTEYETDNELGLVVGQAVHTVVNAPVDGADSTSDGGVAQAAETKLEYYPDGRLKSSRTIKGLDDTSLLGMVFSLFSSGTSSVDQDIVESWEYDTNGRLARHTDGTGHVTDYTLYDHGRLKNVKETTKFGTDVKFEERSYHYDPRGFEDQLIERDVHGTILSQTDTTSDTLGYEIENTVKGANASGTTVILEKDRHAYDAAGRETSTWDAANTLTESIYLVSGLLKERTVAKNAVYYSLYTGQNEDVSQRTVYTYGANGSLNRVDSPSGTSTEYFADPQYHLSWTRQSGVSVGAHTVQTSGAITFASSGYVTTETETDFRGRTIREKNLLTGDEQTFSYDDVRLDSATGSIHRVNQGMKDATSWDFQDRTSKAKYNNFGEVVATTDGNGVRDAVVRDSFGAVKKTTIGMLGESMADVTQTVFTSDIVKGIFTTSVSGAASLSPNRPSKTEVTTTKTDDSGQTRTYQDPEIGHESNVAAAKEDFDYDLGLRTEVSTDRYGAETKNWIDALGRVVRSVDAEGAVTTNSYDANGQLVETLLTHATQDPNFPDVRTTYQYDQLGRQRSTVTTIHNVSKFSATDYFLPGAAHANGWNVISYPTLPGAGPQSHSVANINSRAVKKVTDGLGNTLYVLSADPNLRSDGTTAGTTDAWPAQLTTYDYDANQKTVIATVRSGAAKLVGDTPSIDLSYSGTRVVRSVSNDVGEVIESSVRTSNMAGSDSVGGSSNYFTGGFVVGELTNYGLAGEVTKTRSPMPNTVDLTGDFHALKAEYDAQYRLKKATDLNSGSVTENKYDAFGNVVHTSDGVHSADLEYDLDNRLIGETDKSGNSETISHKGLVDEDQDTGGHDEKIVHDKMGRVVSDQAPGRAPVTYTYNTVGEVVTSTDGDGATVTITYDNWGRKKTVTDALGLVTSYEYDDFGNLKSVTAPLGRKTSYLYDGLGRLVSTTDAENHTTAFTYDANGSRLTLTDASGNRTEWKYDTYGRVIESKNALQKPITYQYNEAGSMSVLTRRDGTRIEYSQDLGAHTTTEKWLTASGSVVKTLTYAFDTAGDMLNATDGSSTIEFGYVDGLLRSETQSLAPAVSALLTTSYTEGRVSSLSAAVNGTLDSTLSYQWTDDGYLRQIQQTAGSKTKSVVYSYDTAGLLSSVERFADAANTVSVVKTTYNYANERLQKITHSHGQTDLAKYVYAYDDAGRLQVMNSQEDGAATFGYDKTDQLISADYADFADLNFSYDATGNRTGTGYVAGTDNRMSEDSKFTYQYDDNGDLIRKTAKSDGHVTEYSYDYHDRLTDVKFHDSSSGPVKKEVTYAYDAFGRRISQKIDGNGDGTFETERYYVNDGQRADQGNAGDEVLLVLDGTGKVVNRYLHGAAVDEVLAEDTISASGDVDTLWTLGDHQGSIRDLVRFNETTSSATVVDHIMYDAFGRTVDETHPEVDHLYGYTGREYDDAIALQYNRARFYDAEQGRWISQDPMSFAAGDVNLYRYAGSRTTDQSDPSGYQTPGEKRNNSENPSSLQISLEIVNDPIDETTQSFETKLRMELALAIDAARGVEIQLEGLRREKLLTAAGLSSREAEYFSDGELQLIGQIRRSIHAYHTEQAAKREAVQQYFDDEYHKANRNSAEVAFEGLNQRPMTEDTDPIVLQQLQGVRFSTPLPRRNGLPGQNLGQHIYPGVSAVPFSEKDRAELRISRKNAEELQRTVSSIVWSSILVGVPGPEDVGFALLGRFAMGARTARIADTIDDAVDGAAAPTKPLGGIGPVSGREFDADNAGGAIQHLTTDRVKVTHRGVDYAERHLDRFGPDGPNQMMIQRLRDIVDGKLKATQTDLNFYTHELRESVRYRRLGYNNGQPLDEDAAYDLWNNAHTATLEDYRLLEGPGVLYHPSTGRLSN
ncbi:MAG: RHS repeat-associated core domain-containing protein [Pirellulales bacterium]